MVNMNSFVYILAFLLHLSVVYSQNLLCTEAFCTEYIKKENNCPTIPKNCEIQNTTHNGLELPFMGPCNCCDYCLTNLDEGDTCALGGPTSSVPTSICGDGLTCVNKVCTKLDTICTRAQRKYDEDKANGLLGHLQVRPKCDRNGNYEPYVCIPGEICYCVDEAGIRIFGEFIYSPMADAHTCKCSRTYNNFGKTLGRPLYPHEHLHCLLDGSYDSLQCIGVNCLCVDKDDGKIAYPGAKMVNRYLISSELMPCFDNTTHVKFEYYRNCENNYQIQYEEIQEFKAKGYNVVGYNFPSCQLDGNYNSVQHNETHKFCVNPDGEILEDYVVDRNSELGTTMNCKCAKTRNIMTSNEKPTCTKNGNYDKLQCRRGLCRCVDENGNQNESEVNLAEKETLSCFEKTV